MIFLLQVFSMVAERFTRRQEHEQEKGPDSGSEQPGAEEPSTSNMEQDHVSRNIHHGQHLEQVGYHKPSKIPMVSKSAMDERTRFNMKFAQPREAKRHR